MAVVYTLHCPVRDGLPGGAWARRPPALAQAVRGHLSEARGQGTQDAVGYLGQILCLSAHGVQSQAACQTFT